MYLPYVVHDFYLWYITNSKDKTIGYGGRRLVEQITERGLSILNGKIQGDWKGEYTFIGVRGYTVIDYVMVNEKINDRICNFKIGESGLGSYAFNRGNGRRGLE